METLGDSSETLLLAALSAFSAARCGASFADVSKKLDKLEALEARCATSCAADESLRAAALRLWAESEAAARTGDRSRLASREGWARASVARLASGASSREAVGAAIAYGALSSYRNAANDRESAAALPRLRAAFFHDFLEGGRLRSVAGEEGARHDIVLCAVPFGVIDAGNVVMVETVASLAPASSARDAALLSWYYAELGRLEDSRRMAAEARRLGGAESSADSVIGACLGFAERCLLAATGDESDPANWHEPEGYGSLYRFQRKARAPFLPVAGEIVAIRAHFAPDQVERGASVIVESRGARRELPMRPVRLDGRESYREAEIGAFEAFERVSYRIALESETGRRESPSYSFSPLSRERIAAAELLSDGSFCLRSASRPEGTALARIERSSGGFELRLSQLPVSPNVSRNEAPPPASSRSGASLFLSGDAIPRFRDGERCIVEGFSGLGLGAIELDLDEAGTIRRARLRLRARPGEKFYGSGERYASVDHSGRSLDSYVFNQYCAQGDRSYIPLPFYSSSSGYGLRLVSRGKARLGFDSARSGYVELELDSDGRSGELGFAFYEGAPHEALRGYLADTCLPALPPRWAFGPWMSSNNWDSQALSLEQVRLTRELGIPATVLVLEQWSDEATFYVWNDSIYERRGGAESFGLAGFEFPASGRWPDPKAMVEEMHSAGLRVLLWQAPVMKYMDGIPHAQRDEDERYMIEARYCLEREGGAPYRIPDYEWFKRSLVPDFANPAARDWWLAKRAYLVDAVGIDGIKTDGGECVYGSAAKDSSGRSGDELRNAYPVEYEGAFHSWLRERRGGDAMTFSRSGFEGAQAFPAHWAGDERSTFEAFRASVRAGISAGLSGIAFWGWDFAGFSGEVPSAELYLRSAAMAALCPIMQYHAESRGEQCRDRTPWNIAERSGDPSVIGAYRSLARLRMNLVPYLWAAAEASSRDGLPMMRALFAEYPGEAYLDGVDDEYLLGPAILVAPVMDEGATSRSLLLPSGRWAPLLGGESLEGGRSLRVAAPLGSPLCGTPAFIREDSAIPLNLPRDFSFPGDVGNSVEGCERLCFLVSAVKGFDFEYRRYDGSAVRLAARRENGKLAVTVENESGSPVWVAEASASSRTFRQAGEGRTELNLG